MKRIILAAIPVLMLTTVALAQRRGEPPPPAPPLEPGASQADVDKALVAAPASLKDQATVIKWKKRLPLQQPFSVQCTSTANLERETQNLKAEATGDRQKSETMLSELEKAGTRAKPEYGSLWYAVAGADREHARPESHITIAVPGATAESTGLPDNPRQGGAWIMNAGTLKAHIMVPNK